MNSAKEDSPQHHSHSHRMWDIAEVVEQILIYVVRSSSFSPTLLYRQRDMSNPWENTRQPSLLLVCRLWYLIGKRLEFTTHVWTIQEKGNPPQQRLKKATRLVLDWRVMDPKSGPQQVSTFLAALRDINKGADGDPATWSTIKELYLVPDNISGALHSSRRETPFFLTVWKIAPLLFANLTLLSIASYDGHGFDFTVLFPSATSQRPQQLLNLRHLFLADLSVAFFPGWLTCKIPPLKTLSLSSVYIPDNLLEPFFTFFCSSDLERFRFIKHQCASDLQIFPDIPGISRRVLEHLSECCPQLESIEVLLDREPLPTDEILPIAVSRLRQLFPTASLIGINFRSVIETSVYHFDPWMTRMDVQTSIGDQHLSLSLVHVFLCSEQAVHLTHLRLPLAFIPVEWFDPEEGRRAHMRWTCSNLRALDMGIRDDHPAKTKKSRYARNIFGFVVTHFQRLESLTLSRPCMSDSIHNGMCFLSRLGNLQSFTLWTDTFRLPVVVSISFPSSQSSRNNDMPRRRSSLSSIREKLLPLHDPLRDIRWMSLNPSSSDIRKGLSSLAYCRKIAKLDAKSGHFGRSPEAKALLWSPPRNLDAAAGGGPLDVTTYLTIEAEMRDVLKEGALWQDIHWFIINCRHLDGNQFADESAKAEAASILVPGMQLVHTCRLGN